MQLSSPGSLSPDLTEQATRFAKTLQRQVTSPRPVLLAVSGGPDSMAMLTLAAASGVPVMVATVDHGLRAEAATEAAMVAAHCATLGIHHATLRPDEPLSGASLQAQARTLRYRLLARHALDHVAAAIATAHHIDDQAETFLMRAARGSGVAGLGGVRPTTIINGVPVVRPLLDWRRAELRAIVRRLSVPFADDPSNNDSAFDRTRFRQLLDANEWLDPPALARAATAAAEADADLAEIAEWLWADRAAVTGTDVALRAADLPRTLQRRLIARAIEAVRAAAGIVQPPWSTAQAMEPLLDALRSGRRATQAGVVAGGRGAAWRFRPAPPRSVHERSRSGPK